MRIENNVELRSYKIVDYLSKDDAINYRNRIQTMIDEEGCNDVNVWTSEHEWLDDDKRYVLFIKGGVDMEKKMSKADLYIELNTIDKKLNHIIDAVGLAEKIES